MQWKYFTGFFFSFAPFFLFFFPWNILLGSTVCTDECCKLLHWFPYWFWWIFCLVSCGKVCSFFALLCQILNLLSSNMCTYITYFSLELQFFCFILKYGVVRSGRKVFLLVPPSKGNLLMFEEWASSRNQVPILFSLSYTFICMHMCVCLCVFRDSCSPSFCVWTSVYYMECTGKCFLCGACERLPESRTSSWRYPLHVSFAQIVWISS